MSQTTRFFLVLLASLGSLSCTVPQYSFNGSGGHDGGHDSSKDVSGASGGGGQPAEAGDSGGTGGSSGTAGTAGTGGSSGTAGTAGTGGTAGCSSNADCAATSSTPICDTGKSTCVQCLASTDCPIGDYCNSSQQCDTGCNSDADCNRRVTADAGTEAGADGGAEAGTDGGTDAAAPHLTCDIASHTCSGCASSADCQPGSLCDTQTSKCVAGCTPQHACPSGQNCCSGTCSDPNTDVSNCGSCGNACQPANGTGACSNGKCAVASCNTGYADCNKIYADGCESLLAQDPDNCGTCGKTCNLPDATAKCTAGQCAVASCNSGYADCNHDPADGCEVQTDTDTLNCGLCGHACSTNHSTPTCKLGVCYVGCNTGFGDCNFDPTDGCETNLNTNVDNCKTCGHICSSSGGTPNCVGGVCGLSKCTAPQADCDGLSSNGCEVDLATDVNNCGSCGNQCAAANATVTCQNKVCAIKTCSTNFADCDKLYTDGCEANLLTDPNHCGSCSKACSSNNGTPSCYQGQCAIQCDTGYDNCDQNVATGCETPLDTVSNCGACNATCTNTHGTTSCVLQNGSFACQPTCASGWGDCNGNPSDGCETPLNTDTNCTACGQACAPPNATGDCSNGSCQVSSCNTGWGNCTSAPGCETNTTNNVNNCGGCGSACSSNNGTPSCSNSTCSISCNTGYKDCNNNARTDGCEINIETDPNNCGSCGHVCPTSAPNCSNGQCISACPSGTADCDGNTANGCETNIASDGNNCGACNKTCLDSQYCNNGTCTSCASGQSDCDKNGTNACESATASDPNNCGGCGNRCGADGTCGCASSSCSGGTIYFSEDFSDNSRGWTMTAGSTWAIGPTSTSSGQEQGNPDPALDHSTTSDNGVAGIVLGGNYDWTAHSAWYLTSPTIDLSGAAGTVNLTFWRWLNCDAQPYTVDTVQVFDGSAWQTLWSNPSKTTITDNSWTRQTFDVTNYKNANFQVRFGFATGYKGQLRAWIMSGWNIDDLSLSSGTCQ